MKKDEQEDQTAFAQRVNQWEWQWVHQRKDYPTKVNGDPVTMSKLMYNKYISKLRGTF